jgi:hypothetical protein
VVDDGERRAADHARAVREPAPVLQRRLRGRDVALEAEERAEHLARARVDEVRLRVRRRLGAALDQEGVHAEAGEEDAHRQAYGAAADDEHGDGGVPVGRGGRGGRPRAEGPRRSVETTRGVPRRRDATRSRRRERAEEGAKRARRPRRRHRDARRRSGGHPTSNDGREFARERATGVVDAISRDNNDASRAARSSLAALDG